MNAWYSLFVVLILVALAFFGAGAGLTSVFGFILPYMAIALFIAGVVYRVISWARSPVPFRIPTTTGQQKSLPWIKSSQLENPHNWLGVTGRMALEVLFFRSLFRNTKAGLKGKKIIYGSSKWLWLGGLVFHWSFLIIFLRHVRYFAEPVPGFVTLLQGLDGFFQAGLPIVYITDVLFLAAVTFLFLRRVLDSRLRYFSLAADYFPLFLLLAIGVTGVLMRYFYKVDIVEVKQLAMGLLSFNPYVPEGVGVLFFIHLFMVSTLIAYFPFSKLMHMAGIFLSSTRNLANNNRMRRHINPWDYPVKVHTYEEYEDEFRDVMKAAGLPLEKE